MRIRYGEITKNTLLILAATGVIAIAATSPNFLINIAREIIKYKKYNKKNLRNNAGNLSRSLSGLNKNKIVIIKENNGKFTIELTERGRKVVKEILFDNMKIEKQNIWDKKWRIVIFDIPEKKLGKQIRNLLRSKLQTIGFYQLQKSVWVHPYPCKKEIQLICEVYEANPYVNMITAEKICNDDSLTKYFNLHL